MSKTPLGKASSKIISGQMLTTTIKQTIGDVITDAFNNAYLIDKETFVYGFDLAEGVNGEVASLWTYSLVSNTRWNRFKLKLRRWWFCFKVHRYEVELPQHANCHCYIDKLEFCDSNE